MRSPRWIWIALLMVFGLVLAEGGRLLWVTVDPQTHALGLSDGAPLPAGLKDRVTPGQYVVQVGPGRFRLTRGWRPPQDIVKQFAPKDAQRVTFSHERHFAALGAKGAACQTCHDRLGGSASWPSRAPGPALEPHAKDSLGRFCSTCHDGRQTVAQVTAKMQGAEPPVNARIFTAFGRRGEASCNRCHVPGDHGQNFVPWHGEKAEHGGAANCASCHRGAGRITNAEITQARTFFQSQMTLLRDAGNQQAFNATLPNNFCAYCHGLDLKAWRGE